MRAPRQPTKTRDVLGIGVHFGVDDLGEAAVAIVDYLR